MQLSLPIRFTNFDFMIFLGRVKNNVAGCKGYVSSIHFTVPNSMLLMDLRELYRAGRLSMEPLSES